MTPWRSGRASGSKLRERGATCPPAFFANWVSVDEAQGDRMVSAFGAPTRAKLAQHGLSSTQDEVRCLLAGVDTTCSRLVVEADGRRVAVILWATARAGDQVVFATCQAPAGAAIQPPCSLVFRSP